VAEVASVMGLRRMLRRRPRTLSGGERAAVAVGRALAAPAASYVMFDEPLAKADTRRREAFVARVREVRRSRPETGFVIASNDPTPLLTVADTVVILDGGRAIQVDSPEEVWDRPVSVRVVAVLGDPAMNLFPARVRHRGAELVADIGARQVVLDRRLEIGEGHTVLVGIHAAELSVAAPGTPFDRALAVTVGSVEASRGVVRFGLGSTPAAVFAMRHPDALSVRAGDRLELTWTTGRVRIFDAESGRTIPGEPPGAPGSGPAG
jgi:ABC-type sugar transport system ATPase subunit